MSWSDCSYYKGDFRFNQLKGRGCYTDIDGKVYKGHVIFLSTMSSLSRFTILTKVNLKYFIRTMKISKTAIN